MFIFSDNTMLTKGIFEDKLKDILNKLNLDMYLYDTHNFKSDSLVS